MNGRFIERKDGSIFDRTQLRDKGKFVKKRVWLTLPDRKFLERNGYTADEADAACRALNIDIHHRIERGESEREVLGELAEFI